MKRRGVSQASREWLAAGLREARRIDCRTVRAASAPRCGRCFGCGLAADVEMLAAGARERH